MLIRLLFIVRRRWPILLLLPLVAAGIGALFSPRDGGKVSDSYTATAIVAVSNEGNVTSVNQMIVAVEQGRPRQSIDGALGDAVGRASTSMKFKEQSAVIQIASTSRDPKIAELTARTYADVVLEYGNGERTAARDKEIEQAEQFLDDARRALEEFLLINVQALSEDPVPANLVVQQQQLQADVSAAQGVLGEIQRQTGGSAIYSRISDGTATKDVQEKLQLPADLRIRVVVALVLGMVGAIGVVAIVEKLNPRIDDPAHAEAIIGAPVLAMVPVMRRRRSQVLKRADPETFVGPFAESFRALRSHLDFRQLAEERELPARVLVVSAAPGEGKSTTAAFLALSYAEAGRSPLVVGGDVRRPTVHNLFEVDRIPGLTTTQTHADVTEALSSIVTIDEISGVNMVPSGPAASNITGLLPKLTALTKAGQRSDKPVIVDSAPLMVANDCLDFLSCVDWVILVVRMGKSTERAVKQTAAALRLNNATIAGCVMIGSMESSDAKRYYYNYYDTDSKADSRA